MKLVPIGFVAAVMILSISLLPRLTASDTTSATAPPTSTGSTSVAPLPTATFPPLPREEPPPPPLPTPCATEVVAPAGTLVHVIGPGAVDSYVPQAFDIVSDVCTGNQFDIDPVTKERLRHTIIAAEGDAQSSGALTSGTAGEAP